MSDEGDEPKGPKLIHSATPARVSQLDAQRDLRALQIRLAKRDLAAQIAKGQEVSNLDDQGRSNGWKDEVTPPRKREKNPEQKTATIIPLADRVRNKPEDPKTR